MSIYSDFELNSDSEHEYDDLRVAAVRNLSQFNAIKRPESPIPIKRHRATSLSRRQLPEVGTLAPRGTPGDRQSAAKALCDHRGDLLDYLCMDPQFRQPNDQIKTDWFYKIVAMDSDDDNALLDEPTYPPRANTSHSSIEMMDAVRRSKQNPWGPSSLKREVLRAEDLRQFGEGKPRLQRDETVWWGDDETQVVDDTEIQEAVAMMDAMLEEEMVDGDSEQAVPGSQHDVDTE